MSPYAQKQPKILFKSGSSPFSNSRLKPTSSRLYSNLKHSVAGEKLVETKLFPSILLEDIPILNDVNQADFTLNYIAAWE